MVILDPFQLQDINVLKTDTANDDTPSTNQQMLEKALRWCR